MRTSHEQRSREAGRAYMRETYGPGLVGFDGHDLEDEAKDYAYALYLDIIGVFSGMLDAVTELDLQGTCGACLRPISEYELLEWRHTAMDPDSRPAMCEECTDYLGAHPGIRPPWSLPGPIHPDTCVE